MDQDELFEEQECSLRLPSVSCCLLSSGFVKWIHLIFIDTALQEITSSYLWEGCIKGGELLKPDYIFVNILCHSWFNRNATLSHIIFLYLFPLVAPLCLLHFPSPFSPFMSKSADKLCPHLSTRDSTQGLAYLRQRLYHCHNTFTLLCRYLEIFYSELMIYAGDGDGSLLLPAPIAIIPDSLCSVAWRCFSRQNRKNSDSPCCRFNRRLFGYVLCPFKEI